MNYIKSYFPYLVLIIFTYSTNIGIITLGLINNEQFVEVSLIIGILNLFCAVVGGSIRHNKQFLKITDNEINKYIKLRIYFSVILIIFLSIFNLSVMAYLFSIRRLLEWIIDPHISDRKFKDYDFIIIFFDIIFFISGTFICFYLKSDFSYIIWCIYPLLIFSIELQDLKFFSGSSFKIKNLFIFWGYDGFAAAAVLIFRYFVFIKNDSFLNDVLFYTILFGSLTGFLVKIILPLTKNFYKQKFYEIFNEYNFTINIITFLSLIIFYNYSSIISFMFLNTLFIAFGIYFRQVLLFQGKAIKYIFFKELYLNSFIIIVYLFITYLDSSKIVYFFGLNAIINFYYYKNICLRKL